METKKSNGKFGLFKLENGVLEIKEVPGDKDKYSNSWNLLIRGGLVQAIENKEIQVINIDWQTLDAGNSANFCLIMADLEKVDEKPVLNYYYPSGNKDAFELGKFLKYLYPALNILKK